MAPILIGSFAAAGLATGFAGALAGSLVGAGLAWAITIGTKMILSIKIKTVKIANLLILLFLLSFCKCFNKYYPSPPFLWLQI
jgi:ABC-type lipoprotein release transport system permease subunit